jgi:hypothetical protein
MGMKLFSEKVKPTLTNSSYNILSVEGFEEIFFGVYEIEINKNKYPVEKISEHNGNPMVSVPVLVEGVKKYYPFVLIQGKPEVLFNENNTMDKVVDNFEEPPQSTPIENIVESNPVVVEEISLPELIDNKREILEQIENAKKEAVRMVSEIKKQKLKETKEEAFLQKRALSKMIAHERLDLVNEFISISNKIKNEIIDENDNRFSEIRETIDNKIRDMSNSLFESLKDDFTTSEKQFDSKIKELVKELYESLQPKIDDELKSIATEIVEKVDSIEKNLNDKLKDKADSVVIENFEGELNSIAKANIELNDKINKGVNKSLSRVGNIDKRVDELTIALSEEVNDRVNKAEDYITNYYKEKIELLENKTFDLNEETRKYFVELITESRNNLIDEVRQLKNEKPIEYIVESKGKKQSINSDDLVKDFDKKINSKIDTEVTRLRRYIAVYSGGGSVAMQFADGGTMNGDLTVVGKLSASEYLGLEIPDVDLSNYLPYTGAESNVDLGSYSLSAASVSISGNMDVDGNTLFVDSVNNRVGIGSTTPNEKLTVVGNISATGNITSSGNLTVTGSFNLVNPQHDGNSVIYLGEGGVTTMQLYYVGSQNKFIIQDVVAGKNIATFNRAFGNYNVTIDNGNLGVGTATPNEKLTVVGNISATGTITASNLVYTDGTIKNIVTISQAAYNDLSPNQDPLTLYIII